MEEAFFFNPFCTRLLLLRFPAAEDSSCLCLSSSDTLENPLWPIQWWSLVECVFLGNVPRG